MFYLLPKLHKNALDPPGHPIVSGNESLTEIICKIIDYYLKPIVTTLPSFTLDTTAALKRLDQLNLDNMILVIADAEALYTSIKHTQGIAAVTWFLQNSNLDNDMCKFLLTLLEFILTHNCFMFKDQIFLQIQGFWEWEIFQCSNIPGINKIQNWIRYIDDIIFVWEGTIDELKKLMMALNENDYNIDLTYSYGRRITFLDTDISINNDGSILTTLPLHQTYPSMSMAAHYPQSHTPASPLCQALHWLPIAQRLQFKTLTLIYKAIHNLSPPYICDMVSQYLPTRNLRSSQDLLLYSPLISSSHNRIQDFSRASPILWNSTPTHQTRAYHRNLQKEPEDSSLPTSLQPAVILNLLNSCTASSSLS
ncbi:unnamed protein product [Ranitomeya imitator]|uniref:Reverse transcriptase domain-containing protein n=1 Tax=Ranitomeya imitator TaxID=111125 RepID=A0ABN9MQN9_9NEOB|nr:unnamed protein product [Ranitomeya imitator]